MILAVIAGMPLFGRFGTNSAKESWLATHTASPRTPKQCHAGSYSRIKPGHACPT